MDKATFIKDVSHNFHGEARLYQVDAGGTVPKYIAVSSVSGFYANETMAFSADASGNVTDWGELGVAYPSGQFEAALANAGIELVG